MLKSLLGKGKVEKPLKSNGIGVYNSKTLEYNCLDSLVD